MNKSVLIKAIAKGILIGAIPAICFIIFCFWAGQSLRNEVDLIQSTETPDQSFLEKEERFPNEIAEQEFEQDGAPISIEVDRPPIDSNDSDGDSESETSESEILKLGWPTDDPPPALDPSLHQPIREFYRKHWNDPAMRAKWHTSVEKSRQRLLKELAVAETAVPAAQEIDQEMLKLNHILVDLGAEPFVTGGKRDMDAEVQEVRARIWELKLERAEYWQQLDGMASILFDEATDDILGSWLMEKAGWVDEYLTTTPAWISEF